MLMLLRPIKRPRTLVGAISEREKGAMISDCLKTGITAFTLTSNVERHDHSRGADPEPDNQATDGHLSNAVRSALENGSNGEERAAHIYRDLPTYNRKVSTSV